MTILQTQKGDLFTIENEPISSLDLMERASIALVRLLRQKLNKSDKIAVLCGSGNNGGDALAVARLLLEVDYQVDVYACSNKGNRSTDNQRNLEQLNHIITLDKKQLFNDYDVLIDGLFGSGLTRPLSGYYAEIVEGVNESSCKVYSIDIPSGMFGDKVTRDVPVISSDWLITLQRPKLSFFFPESKDYIKNWDVVDIWLNASYLHKVDSNYYILDSKISRILRGRERFSHKGTYGHAALFSGSFGRMGAAVLCSRACVRSGVGLLTVYIPACGYNIMQTSVPEAMVFTMGDRHLNDTLELKNYTVVGVGPGIGVTQETTFMLKELITRSSVPMVLDADALNILSKNKEYLKLLPEGSILTPHPKEFERLVGKCADSLERIEKQISLSSRYNCIVVYKDAYTTISSPSGNVYFNTTGNPGMATGGSGDVLTGIITGLIAQGYNALEAALLGVYAHGRSGDSALKVKDQMTLIASDLIDNLNFENW